MLKNLLYSLILLTFFSCGSPEPNNDNLPYTPVNETIDLNAPQFINLQVPGGWAYSSGGLRGLIIYNVNGNQFKAFDRSCPHLPMSNCTTMTMENNIKMTCPCDGSEFNILNGAPLTEDITQFAREYNVRVINNTVLQISNF